MTLEPVLAVPSRTCEAQQGSRFGPEGDTYEIGEELGSGSDSRVFACRRCRTGEQFAVKVVNIQRLRLLGDLAMHMSRLNREVQILRQLRHERIVNLEDFHRTDDSFFLVMERVQGGELFNQILNKCLTEVEARHVFRQLLEGVGYMHSKSIIHRDLKPENILIVRSQPATKDTAEILHDVKIADFGLSKAILDGASLAKTCVGTPQYWAPEVLNTQRSGGTYDHAADFWGLGAVLFVMLCGRYPFDGRRMPLDEQIRTAAFSMRTPKWQGISDAAKSLVKGLLEVDPAERLQLEECLHHPWVTGMALCPGLRDPAAGSQKQKKVLGRRRRAPNTSCEAREAREVRAAAALQRATSSSQAANAAIHLEEEHQVESTGDVQPRAFSLWARRLLIPLATLAIATLPFLRPVNAPPTIADFHSNLEPLGMQVALLPPSIVPATTTVAPWSTAEALGGVLPGQAPPSGPTSSGPQANEQKLGWPLEALNSPLQALRVPNVQIHSSGLLGSGEVCTEQESIFRLNELLKLQVSIIGSLEMAWLAFRHADMDLADATQQTFQQARELFQHAADTVSRYGEVAQEVHTTVLPDLQLAVEEQEPALAMDLLGVVKSWVSDMKSGADVMRERYAKLQQAVLHLVGRAQRTKLSADQRLEEAIQEELQERASPASEGLAALELQDLCNSQLGQSDKTADLSATSAAGALSKPFSLNSTTQELFKQLKMLSIGQSASDAVSLGASANPDEESWKKNVIDLLFLAPGITRLTLPPVEPLNFSVEDEAAALSATNGGLEEQKKGLPEYFLSDSRQARTASRSAAALLQALRELRRVDMILHGCSTFWANMDGTVKKLAQMKDVTERLIGFATNSARLRERFDQRLREYSNFWALLERLCRQYTSDHHSALVRMQEFVRELSYRADLLDTAESARAGVQSAYWRRNQRVKDTGDG